MTAITRFCLGGAGMSVVLDAALTAGTTSYYAAGLLLILAGVVAKDA